MKVIHFATKPAIFVSYLSMYGGSLVSMCACVHVCVCVLCSANTMKCNLALPSSVDDNLSWAKLSKTHTSINSKTLFCAQVLTEPLKLDTFYASVAAKKWKFNCNCDIECAALLQSHTHTHTNKIQCGEWRVERGGMKEWVNVVCSPTCASAEIYKMRLVNNCQLQITLSKHFLLCLSFLLFYSPIFNDG